MPHFKPESYTTVSPYPIVDNAAATIEFLKQAFNAIEFRRVVDGNQIVGYSKLKDCIRLIFWSGQSFEESPLKADGNFKAASARFTGVTQVDNKELERWLELAIEIQWDYKNIVKRKGRLVRLK